jgi:hypothetical protein
MFSIPNARSNSGWFHAVAWIGANATVEVQKNVGKSGS